MIRRTDKITLSILNWNLKNNNKFITINEVINKWINDVLKDNDLQTDLKSTILYDELKQYWNAEYKIGLLFIVNHGLTIELIDAIEDLYKVMGYSVDEKNKFKTNNKRGGSFGNIHFESMNDIETIKRYNNITISRLADMLDIIFFEQAKYEFEKTIINNGLELEQY